MDLDLKQFCFDLPKIELHAHLIGSCSENTIKKLVKLNPNIAYPNSIAQGLKEIFNKFEFLHSLSNSLQSLAMVTKDVIEEFAYENVKYLELRTTPRSVDGVMTQYDYVNVVVNSIRASSEELNLTSHNIIVKLLLSIDRSKSIEDAWLTLELTQKFAAQHNPIVVGLDLSGNPYSGDVEKLIPVLKSAKERGIKISMHIAEIEGCTEESELLYSVKPDRLGHATYLRPQFLYSQKFVETIISNKTPIEICITSNIISETVKDISDHQLNYWYQSKHPCIICTDDKGVFNTSLSNEYLLAAEGLQLSPVQIWDLSFNSIDYIFDGAEIKKELRRVWEKDRKRFFS